MQIPDSDFLIDELDKQLNIESGILEKLKYDSTLQNLRDLYVEYILFTNNWAHLNLSEQEICNRVWLVIVSTIESEYEIASEDITLERKIHTVI